MDLDDAKVKLQQDCSIELAQEPGGVRVKIPASGGRFVRAAEFISTKSPIVTHGEAGDFLVPDTTESEVIELFTDYEQAEREMRIRGVR